jgi:hypothetical protein
MASIEIKDLDKQKKQLKASFDMWEKTINETIESMKNARKEDNTKKYTDDQIEDKVEMLRNGQQDIIDKWTFLGGTMEELRGEKKSAKPVVKKKIAAGKTVMEQIAEIDEEKTTPKVKKVEKKVETEPVTSRTPLIENTSKLIPERDESNPMASYDIIPLPSKGECYKNKQGRIAVSYLTAMDENIIVSPNLYRDNMVLDIILKEKVRDPEIDPDDLLDGDRDAIILFLRSSAYGNMYSVSTTDPDTKQSFDTQIDLSKIKYKDFTLVGDENGYFDYELPLTKDKIKFRFLTHRDYINLTKLDELEISSLRKAEIEKYNGKLQYYLGEDETLTMAERKEISNAITKLKEWSEKFDEDGVQFSHRTTNELEMQIVSVNGNTDRNFIHNYVINMPIKDASSLRKYITKNTPGVDYNFEIQKPESLGGGSMNVFLQFDQFIFLVDSE